MYLFYSKLDHVKCFTHRRIKEEYHKMIEEKNPNLKKYPHKDRTYFTSVGMDVFEYRKCVLFVKDEYEYVAISPICALPKQEMKEGSYRKISEEVRTKN